jgi:hypothetical protein
MVTWPNYDDIVIDVFVVRRSKYVDSGRLMYSDSEEGFEYLIGVLSHESIHKALDRLDIPEARNNESGKWDKTDRGWKYQVSGISNLIMGALDQTRLEF